MAIFGGNGNKAAQALAEGPWYEQLENLLSTSSKPVEEAFKAFYDAPRKTAESFMGTCAQFVYHYPHATAAIVGSTILLGLMARKAYKDGWWRQAKSCVKSFNPGVSVDANFFGFSFGAYAKPAKSAQAQLGELFAGMAMENNVVHLRNRSGT